MRNLITATFILVSSSIFGQNFSKVINVETKQIENFSVFISYNIISVDYPKHNQIYDRTGEVVITKEEEIIKAEAVVKGLTETVSYKWDKINNKHIFTLGKNIYELIK